MGAAVAYGPQLAAEPAPAPTAPAQQVLDPPTIAADAPAGQTAPAPAEATDDRGAAAQLAVEAEARLALPPADDWDEHPHRQPPREERRSYVEDGAGPRLSFGRAAIEGLEPSWYVRFETEYFQQEATAQRRRIGPLVGVLLGADGWGGDGGWGLGLPTTFYFGVRHPLFFRQPVLDVVFTMGLGWHWVVWDRADGDGGLGIMAPLSIANFGLDLGGVRLLGEAGAQYRWQWGADDRYQLRVGGVLSFHSELWDG